FFHSAATCLRVPARLTREFTKHEGRKPRASERHVVGCCEQLDRRRAAYQFARRLADSCGRTHVLANNTRMTCGNSQQRDCGTFWSSSSLFPIAKCVHTDSHGSCKLSLRKAHELSQSSYVFGRFELTLH